MIKIESFYSNETVPKPRRHRWVICATKIAGPLQPVQVLTRWRHTGNGVPMFRNLDSDYTHVMQFERDEVEQEVKIIQLVGGDDFYVFALPVPE